MDQETEVNLVVERRVKAAHKATAIDIIIAGLVCGVLIVGVAVTTLAAWHCCKECRTATAMDYDQER